MSDIDKSEAVIEDISEEKAQRMQAARYKDSQSSVDDNKSSGWVLLSVGIIGIVVVVLGILGIIPFKFGNNYLFYGVFCAIFVLFLVMGVISFANAKKFESKAKGEKTLKDSLIKWADKNLSAEEIDNEIGDTELESDEILYFKRLKIITDKLNKQFVNLNPVMLENLIDNVIYEKIYPLPEPETEEDEDSDDDDDFDYYDEYESDEAQDDSSDNAADDDIAGDE